MDARPPTTVPGLFGIGASVAFASDPLRALPDAARARGDVFAMRAFGRSFVVVAGETAVRALQGDLAARLERRSFYAAFARELGVDGFILGADGADHARLRAATRAVYARELLAPHLPRVAAVVRARAARVPDRFRLSAEVARWCLAGYAPALGRIDAQGWEDDALTFARTALALGVTLLPPIAAKVPAYTRAKESLRAFAAALIADARRTTDGDATVGAALARTFPDDAAAAGYLLFTVLAVAQYVSRTVAWMIAHAAADPALARELSAELAAHYHPDALDVPMLKRLERLRSLYRECLRRYPAQAALPYVAREDLAIEGTPIAAGTLILFAGATGHFDPANYHDPWRFDATRFLRPTRCGAAGFVPFGYGDRTCTAAGQTELLALAVAASALSVLDLRASRVPSAVLDPLPGPNPLFWVRVAARRSIVATVDPVRWAAALVGNPAEADGEVIAKLLADARPTRVGAGVAVVREGDVADAFYVIQSGRVRVDRGRATVCALGPGDFFGELGLLLGGHRTATVTTETAAELLVIDGSTFRALVAEGDLVTAEIARLARRRYMHACLRRALPRVSASRLASHVADATLVTLAAGEPAVRQGESADAWYVIGRGTLDVEIDGVVHASLGAGDAFGETGLLRGAPRNATVRATAGGAEVLRVPAEAFHAMMAASPESRGDVVASMLARIGDEAAREAAEG